MSARDDSLIKAFASELKFRRQEAGISQEELAHQAQINRTYVAKLELAQNQPTLTVLAKLAGGLGIGLPELIEATLARSAREVAVAGRQARAKKAAAPAERPARAKPLKTGKRG